MAATIRQRTFTDPVKARELGELARDIQLQLDAIQKRIDSINREIGFGSPVDLTPSSTNDDGTSEDAARADHVHGMSGFASSASLANHHAQHAPGGSDALATAAAGTIQPDDSAAEGSAASFARSDHKHAIVAATAGAITPGDSAAEGSATSFARSDHQHSVPAFGTPGTIAPDDTASGGSAATFARSDHRHAITADTPGTIQPDDSAAEGSAATFARSDHRHAIVAAAPSQGVGGGNTEGSSTSFARADHDHKLRETGGPTDLDIGAIAGGQVLTRNGTQIIGTDLFTSSGIWFPDCPPASPSSYDDEFAVAGSGAPSGWTEFDQNGTVVVTTADGFLQLSITSNATKQIAGVYKAMPTEAEWFAWARVALQGAGSVANQLEGGLFVCQDIVGSPTTADFSTAGCTLSGTSNTLSVQKQSWTAYNAAGAVAGTVAAPPDSYMGIGYDGTNLTCWWSSHGISWIRVVTAAKPFTPVYVGLYGLATNSNAGFARFDFFRVAIGTGVSSSLTRDITRGKRI